MKLFLNATSPYARLVLVTAWEAGHRQIELAWSDPWSTPPELTAVNPFSTVPVLVTDKGVALLESTLICEHLMTLEAPAPCGLRPVARCDENALARLATGKNVMDSAFRRVVIERFFSDAPCRMLAARTEAAIGRALGRLEPLAPLTQEPDNADLCLAVALDYVRFRLKALFLSATGPRTRQWLDAMSARASFECSTPARLASCPATVGGLNREDGPYERAGSAAR